MDFKTGPFTNYDDWSTPPVCAIYAKSDTRFAKSLSGKVPSGSYVTRCTGGVSNNYEVDDYINGVLTITPVYQTVPTTVYFDVLSPVLKLSERNKLQSLVRGRVKTGAVYVQVNGYVQPTRNSSNDFSLSKARADSVARYLTVLGLDSIHESVGKGKGSVAGASSRKVVVIIKYSTG